MAIEVACSCGKVFQVRPENAGRKGKCSVCGARLMIPYQEPLFDEAPEPSPLPRPRRPYKELAVVAAIAVVVLAFLAVERYQVGSLAPAPPDLNGLILEAKTDAEAYQAYKKACDVHFKAMEDATTLIGVSPVEGSKAFEKAQEDLRLAMAATRERHKDLANRVVALCPHEEPDSVTGGAWSVFAQLTEAGQPVSVQQVLEGAAYLFEHSHYTPGVNGYEGPDFTSFAWQYVKSRKEGFFGHDGPAPHEETIADLYERRKF